MLNKRAGDQSLKLLVIFQGVESYQPFPENFIRISSRRSSDKIQNLRGHFLREDSYHVVEFCLGNGDAGDRELGVRLGEQHLCCIGQKAGSFVETLATLAT